jgi:hypothetical protein
MTKMKKRLLLIASVPITIAVILGVLALLPPSPGVTKANFDRIEKEMTRAQVEAVFGGQGTKDLPFYPRFGKGLQGHWGTAVVYWETHDGSFAIVEFVDDCVTDKEWQDSDESFLAKIRRWLHLR